MKTLCIVGHPDCHNSSSQQFLIQSGLANTKTTYLDIVKDEKADDWSYINQLIEKHDQLIFQFPLYWYQMPAQLKSWLDQMLYVVNSKNLMGKNLGLVVVVGSKASHYQAGGKVGRTLSELLSNFEVIAKIFAMNYRPIFPVYQFQYMSEKDKLALMWRYSFYLDSMRTSSSDYHQYLIDHANALDGSSLEMTDEQLLMWQNFLDKLLQNGEEIDEIMAIMKHED